VKLSPIPLFNESHITFTNTGGESLCDAFLYNTIGMFNYISDLSKFQVRHAVLVEATGHDLTSLLHNFMDTCLSVYGEHNYFIMKDFKVLNFVVPINHQLVQDSNKHDCIFSIKVYAYGDFFRDSQVAGNSDSAHLQGTEVKAITYSAMQIFSNGQVFTANNDFNAGNNDAKESDQEIVGKRQDKLRGSNDIFVIVDI
jgi:SHS2 domain-containing protein